MQTSTFGAKVTALKKAVEVAFVAAECECDYCNSTAQMKFGKNGQEQHNCKNILQGEFLFCC